jgi:hypothetical protein
LTVVLVVTVDVAELKTGQMCLVIVGRRVGKHREMLGRLAQASRAQTVYDLPLDGVIVLVQVGTVLKYGCCVLAAQVEAGLVTHGKVSRLNCSGEIIG